MRSAHHYYPMAAFQLQALVLLPLEGVKHNIPLHASQRLNMSNMTGLRWTGYYPNKVICKYNYLFANSFHLTYKCCQSAFWKEGPQSSAIKGCCSLRVYVKKSLLPYYLHHVRPVISFWSYKDIVRISHFLDILDSWKLFFVLSTLSSCHTLSISELILVTFSFYWSNI